MRFQQGPRRRMACHLRTSPDRAEALRPALLEAGAELTDTAVSPADVMVVDLSPAALGDTPAGTAIKTARQDGYGEVIVFLLGAEQDIDSTLHGVIGQDLLVRETHGQRALIRALHMATEMTASAREVGVRLASAASLQRLIHTPSYKEPAARTILQCAPSPLALDVMGDLSSRTSTSATIRSSQSLNALEMREGDALVLLAEGNRRRAASVVRLLRRHSDLFDIPILVLEEDPKARHHNYWSAVGADHVSASADACEAVAVLEQLRHRRTSRLRVEGMLRASTLNRAGAPSRLADLRFFEACLTERARINRGISALGALRVTAATGDGHDDAMAEVAVYLAMATRLTDLVARVRDDLFLVSLPDCDATAARQTMDGMARMVTDLRFGAHDQQCTFTAATHVITSQTARNPREMVRGAIRGVSDTAPQAIAPVLP